MTIGVRLLLLLGEFSDSWKILEYDGSVWNPSACRHGYTLSAWSDNVAVVSMTVSELDKAQLSMTPLMRLA